MKSFKTFENLGIHPSWFVLFDGLFKDKRMINLQKELSKNNFVPKKEDVFNCFKIPKDSIHTIILGQDPYPNPIHAMGIAFGTYSKDNKALPQSLQQLYNCMFKCYDDIVAGYSENQDHTLNYLQHQGVLMLNSSLTTKIFHPGLHTHLWRYFIDAVIQDVNCKLLVRLGDTAKSFNKEVITIDVVHPTSDLYDKKELFLNSNLFNLIDEEHEKLKIDKIKWYM